MAHAEKCPVCEGHGTVLGRDCHGCDGRGWVEVSGQEEFLDAMQKAVKLVNGLKDAIGREKPSEPVIVPAPYPVYPSEPYPWWQPTVYYSDDSVTLKQNGEPWRCCDSSRFNG